MLKIYLVRHGQAGFEQDDYDALSERGHSQAKRLGAFFAAQNITFDGVITGSMQRHRETLSGIRQGMGGSLGPAYENNDWNEYDHHNILAAMDERFADAATMRDYFATLDNPQQALKDTFVQAVERWVSGENDPHYKESWSHFQTRIEQGLKAACDHQGQRLLVVTSGGPISVVARKLLGLPESGFLQLNWVLANGGVSRVLKGRNGVRLSTLNDYSAFDGDERLITYK